MKKRLKIITTVLIVLSIMLMAGCQKKGDKELSLGKIDGNKYTNEYFGFTAELPQDWNVADQETMKQMMDKGQEVVAKDNEKLQKKLDLAEIKLLNLFMATKNPLDFQGINPNILSNAEKLSTLQGIKDGKEYLEASKKLLEGNKQIPFKFDKEIYTETISGKDFAVLEATLESGDIKITQKYYSLIIDKYALNFICFYSDSDGLDDINNFIGSIKFSE